MRQPLNIAPHEKRDDDEHDWDRDFPEEEVAVRLHGPLPGEVHALSVPTGCQDGGRKEWEIEGSVKRTKYPVRSVRGRQMIVTVVRRRLHERMR